MLNLAANHRRRFARTRHAVQRWRGASTDSAVDQYPSDLGDLAALSPTARAVLYLHHVEGLSLELVAERLELQASTVRQTASRARRQLRIRLEEES